MSSEDPTALSHEQASTERLEVPTGSAAWLRRYSAQFGWPMLLLYLIVPQGDWVLWVGPHLTWIAGTLLFFIALFFRLSSRGYDRNQAFVWSGAYRYVRNPVELGALLAYLGGALILKIDPVYAMALLLAAFFYMSWNSNHYEKELLVRVGPHYLKYMSRVRRWIPSLLPGVNRSNRDYVFRLAVIAERDSLFWLLGFAAVYAFRNRLF